MPGAASVSTVGSAPLHLLLAEGPDLETQLWAEQSVAAIEPRVRARCHVRGRSGVIATGGTGRLAGLSQDPDELQQRTDKSQSAGCQRNEARATSTLASPQQ